MPRSRLDYSRPRMDAVTDTRMPRLAPILLIGTLAGLAIVRPGNLSGDTAVGYRLLTTLAAVAAVGYVAWRFHGILPAAAAIILLRFSDVEEPATGAFLERGADAIFLATLAIGIGAAGRQGHSGRLPWILLAVASALVAFFGWYGRELPIPEDDIARARLWHLAAVVSVLSVVVGLTARRASWRDRLRLIGVMLLVPAAGLAAAVARGHEPPTLSQADWPAIIDEWKAAVSNRSWDQGAWRWTDTWLAGPLILIGVWRTLARGRTQVRIGEPPLTWLVTVAGVGAIVALGARPLASASLALAATGALLTVFGIADLIQSLVERVALKPPEPGPVNVPRVK
jgi:hypothetical protein